MIGLRAFLKESNQIEGISEDPDAGQLSVAELFLDLPHVEVRDLCAVVSVFQPSAVLRDRPGLDVWVGDYYPPRGGPEIRDLLEELLLPLARSGEPGAQNPHYIHCEYENLHPFTDGNGRSGRLLWLWQMRRAPLGFLHHFYYQTLASRSPRPR